MSGSTPTPGADSGPLLDVAAPRPGDVIGSYRLVRLIGEGATGRVFEVQHLTIGRLAAMKILAPEHAARPGAIKRLFSEAKAVNQINHPHIVAVTDLVEADGSLGVNAIVMELLEGQSLGQAMATGRLPPERYLPILAQVADALDAAHAARFVHRDLKPENIFLATNAGSIDYVKLLDFGLVKTITETLGAEMVTRAVSTHATAEGVFVGTPAYASPEQASGRAVDHRTDIYSLGVILYELLCGRLPFEGRNFGEYLVKHLTQPPPPSPPEVMRNVLTRTLDGVARRCLAKEPTDRFERTAELRDIFQRLARGESAGSSMPRGGVTSAMAALGTPRRRWLAGAGAAGVVALALLWPRGRRSSRPNRTASLAPERDPVAVAARGPRVEPLARERTVHVTFESDPPGAEVRDVERPEILLGVTRFPTSLPATGRAFEVEIRLAGHEPQRRRLVLSGDAQVIQIKLRRSPAPPVSSPRPRKASDTTSKKPLGKPSRNATLNPFQR